ncbi:MULTISPECIES: dienelactone hydrolase family protein [Kitasatospora]|uniref:Dienelactone hydrolase domain-containing protein n=1 Tax=Kitasatospora cystarginea TaxID=58350 RepID=A0ABP5S0Q0_9ACTN
MTREQVLADVGTAIGHLRAASSGRVAMVGLSMGGHIAYLAATAHDLDAVVVFYGGWLPTTEVPLGRPEPTLSRTAAITARVLFLVGEHDHIIPPNSQQEIRDALHGASVSHEFVVYPGVGHRFLDTDPDAAKHAWKRVQAFLTGPDHAEQLAHQAR